jgi:peroxiredoxin
MKYKAFFAICIALSSLAVASVQGAPATAAPDFTLPARDGTKVRLSDLKGQVVMINFWATWCGPCRQEMPLLGQLQDKYEPLGFTLLGVNVEPDSAAAVAWLKNVPVQFPVLFDTQSAVATGFGVEGMPSSVFIDRAGNVRYVHRGYQPGDEAKYADMIRSLLKE